MYRLEFPDQTQRHLGRAIQMQAEHNGDTTFIMYDEVRYSYAEANQKINELAGGLTAAGISAGDRITFFMSSAPEVIFLVLAANKLGALWVPVNTDYKGAWLEDTLNRSHPSMIVTDSDHSRLIADLQAQLEGAQLVVLGDANGLRDAVDFRGL